MRLLLRSGRRYFTRHAWQLLLATLGIGLGVAVVVALELASGSANRSFERATETVLGRATHRVVGGSRGIDESVYRKLRVESGWRRIAPVLEGTGSVHKAGMAEQRRAVTVLGVDVFAEGPLRGYLAFASAPQRFAADELVAVPGTAVLADATAAELGTATGDSVVLQVSGQAHELRIADTIRAADPLTREGLRSVLVVDIATAQDLFGRPGRIDRIDVCLASDEVQRFTADLPDGLRLEPTAARRGALAEITRAFRTNLTALGYLAVLVGAFLIYNTVSFAVVQRRQHFGVLRALGATRGQILRAVLGEALLLGVAGSALGIGLGIGLAQVLLGAVSQAIQDHYASVSVTSIAIDGRTLGFAAALGVLTCVLAALVPALEAVRTTPRSVMQRTALESRVRRSMPRIALTGAVLGVVGAAVLAISERSLSASWLGLLAVTLAVSLLTPYGAVGILTAARPLLRRAFGAPGGMAATGAMASLSRTAVAVTALMLAVAATVGLAAMIQSFRLTVERWLGNTLQADVYISVRAPSSQHTQTNLDPSVVASLRTASGVRDFATYRWSNRRSEFGDVRVVGLRAGAEILAGFTVLQGEAVSAVFRSGRGVMVSEPFAWRHGVAPGSKFRLTTDRGDQTVVVASVFQDYASERGHIMMSRDRYDALYEDPGVTSMSLLAADGVDVEELVARLTDQVGARQALDLRSNRTLVATSLSIFDRTFAVTDVLRLLCMIVAFLGITSSLLALQLERQREVGVLRAVGATPGQVGRMLLAQTGLLGLCAGLLALPVGALLAWLMVAVINRRSFGWTILDLSLSPGVLLQAVGVAVLAALLAGIYPAWSLGRVAPARALREE